MELLGCHYGVLTLGLMVCLDVLQVKSMSVQALNHKIGEAEVGGLQSQSRSGLHTDTVSALNEKREDGSVFESTDCSWRGPVFNYKHAVGSSQPSQTPFTVCNT